MTEALHLSNSEPQKTFPLKRYYVCYLDILGVRERLFKGLSEISPSSKDAGI